MGQQSNTLSRPLLFSLIGIFVVVVLAGVVIWVGEQNGATSGASTAIPATPAQKDQIVSGLSASSTSTSTAPYKKSVTQSLSGQQQAQSSGRVSSSTNAEQSAKLQVLESLNH